MMAASLTGVTVTRVTDLGSSPSSASQELGISGHPPEILWETVFGPHRTVREGYQQLKANDWSLPFPKRRWLPILL